MRIAFFLTSFPVVSETFILRQITGLLDLGHEVDIYAEWPPENGDVHPEVSKYGLLGRTTYVGNAIPPDSGYWEMPVWPISGETWLPGAEKAIPNVKRLLQAVPTLGKCFLAAPRLTLTVLDEREYGYQAASLSSLYRLSSLAWKRRRYDVLHAHFGPTGNTFRFARDLFKAPLIVTFHGYDFSTLPRKEGRGVYLKLFDAVDMVTVNSDYTGERVEDLGCPRAKLRNLAMGVNPEDFPFRARTHRPGEPVRILSVARLVEKKGLEYSLRAVAEIRQKYPEVRYDIIGEGPLRPQLIQLIEQLGLKGSTILHGARDGAFVRRMMEEADLFLLASVTAADGDQEGTPVSLMEAQASGMPVISARHSGIPEVVPDGRSGFLVPERDVAGLADRLTYLIERPETWPEMGRLGRRHVEDHYDVRRLNRQLVELYEEAVTAYRHGRQERTRRRRPTSMNPNGALESVLQSPVSSENGSPVSRTEPTAATTRTPTTNEPDLVCPCCGGCFPAFLTFGLKPRPNAQCPGCGALERHRLMWLYLRDRTDLFSARLRVLHFAPEEVFQRALASLPNLDYVCLDLEPAEGFVQMDITDIRFEDDSCDVILCSHVLEHVPNDHKAMSELYRVLRPGGWAILQVPLDRDRTTTFEDPKVVSPEERQRLFGQHDHVRVYGRDYKGRLEAAGFAVRVDGYVKELSADVVRKHALPDEDIYFCTKPKDHEAA